MSGSDVHQWVNNISLGEMRTEGLMLSSNLLLWLVCWHFNVCAVQSH